MLVHADGCIAGTVGGGEMESRVIGEAVERIAHGGSERFTYSLTDPVRGDPGVCGGTMEVFVEAIVPEPTILVIGVGHVGKAVVHLARWLGMRVIASDDRAEFCNPEATPGADEYVVAPISELPQQITFTSQTYVLLTTRNISVDMAGLPELLQAPSAYVGVIGSRRRWATTRQKLLDAGVSESDADRVISPMGLELGAETPEEIAISMLSEIIMLRRGGDGRRMNGS